MRGGGRERERVVGVEDGVRKGRRRRGGRERERVVGVEDGVRKGRRRRGGRERERVVGVEDGVGKGRRRGGGGLTLTPWRKASKSGGPGGPAGLIRSFLAHPNPLERGRSGGPSETPGSKLT